jgi:uncharacterized protein
MIRIFFNLIFILFLINTSFALDVPILSNPVVDNQKLLSRDQQNTLNRILKKLNNNGKGPQFQVLIIPSLEDESLEDFAIKVFDTWKLGDEKRDDGLLLLISIKERKIRVEVGQGLEGSITDIQAFDAIREMRPYFKKKRFFSGIIVSLNYLSNEIGHPLKSMKKVKRVKYKKDNSGFLLEVIFIVFFIILSRGRSSRRFSSGRYYSYGSSWNNGSGSGGNSWGGGGGMSSGGGASGGW